MTVQTFFYQNRLIFMAISRFPYFHAVAIIEEEKREAQLERKRLQDNFEQHEQLDKKQQEDIRKASY